MYLVVLDQQQRQRVVRAVRALPFSDEGVVKQLLANHVQQRIGERQHGTRLVVPGCALGVALGKCDLFYNHDC